LLGDGENKLFMENIEIIKEKSSLDGTAYFELTQLSSLIDELVNWSSKNIKQHGHIAVLGL
jgi:hypothetical protein